MRPTHKPQLVIALLAASTASWLHSSDAAAYCRTTTCNPSETDCGETADGCLASGLPLFWPDLCTTFGVHESGSVFRNISYTRASEVAEAAFQSWISVDCGGGEHPYVGVVNKGKIYCDRLEFNHGGPSSDAPNAPINAQGPNANVIVFRDEAWPYNDESRTIALTTITFSKRTGEILDADIEVNSFGVELSTGNENVTSDLQSILAHEIGHFFGLAHSIEEAATMNKDYDRGDKSFRSLSPDDAAGMCSIYPPVPGQVVTDCTGEGPRYGFSRYCGSPEQADGGCSVPAAGPQGSTELRERGTWLGLALLGLALAVQRTRRRRFPLKGQATSPKAPRS